MYSTEWQMAVFSILLGICLRKPDTIAEIFGIRAVRRSGAEFQLEWAISGLLIVLLLCTTNAELRFLVLFIDEIGFSTLTVLFLLQFRGWVDILSSFCRKQ